MKMCFQKPLPWMFTTTYESRGQTAYDSVLTWPPKRAPIPFFKPHFDGHYTPVSKFLLTEQRVHHKFSSRNFPQQMTFSPCINPISPHAHQKPIRIHHLTPFHHRLSHLLRQNHLHPRFQILLQVNPSVAASNRLQASPSSTANNLLQVKPSSAVSNLLQAKRPSSAINLLLDLVRSLWQ